MLACLLACFSSFLPSVYLLFLSFSLLSIIFGIFRTSISVLSKNQYLYYAANTEDDWFKEEPFLLVLFIDFKSCKEEHSITLMQKILLTLCQWLMHRCFDTHKLKYSPPFYLAVICPSPILPTDVMRTEYCSYSLHCINIQIHTLWSIDLYF